MCALNHPDAKLAISGGTVLCPRAKNCVFVISVESNTASEEASYSLRSVGDLIFQMGVGSRPIRCVTNGFMYVCPKMRKEIAAAVVCKSSCPKQDHFHPYFCVLGIGTPSYCGASLHRQVKGRVKVSRLCCSV